MTATYGLLIGSKEIFTDDLLPVQDKYSGDTIAYICQARQADVNDAVRAASQARKEPLSPYRRSQILYAASTIMKGRRDELAAIIAAEAGKPLKDALVEVGRAIETFRLSAEEATRITGEMVPVEAYPGSENRLAFTIRAPRGTVCAISPFNFPLNLLCHKVAPALAAGNAVITKPASTTPLSAYKVGEILQEAGLPAGWYNLLVGPGSTVGEWLLDHQEINYYTFTGSYEIGKRVQERAGFRKTTLELGSNAATIIHKDADLELAAPLCARMAFANAGQVCISVQRLLVHRDVYQSFRDALIKHTKALVLGDPKDPTTDVGPLISAKEADRIMAWIEEACNDGAQLLSGGTRRGNMIEPTILADVKGEMKVWCQEIFGPVVTLVPYDSLEEAIEQTNQSEYGLQAGVFTRSIDVAFECAKKLHVGGVIINDTSAHRTDSMPYGGVKNSGTGREGPKYAVQEMTESKVIVINHRM
ncbi:aldehyde dehydrogenase family protein [Heliorestis convoluta]|uniref:3-sulfolactaldehyde dehydrogenase n=1 Tax=Heliorestis convoluta TaxID=356322 RepID=A0A5Q2N2F2_9FIRM|nr:aldehyde dehydrogenase family protein [Heliorestis convoluta]QGG48451.1 aldehyde dehydrogenase family protein [Heliorestis convoluta]